MITCPGGPPAGVSVTVAAVLTAKADAAITVLKPEYTVTKSEAVAVPDGTAIVVADGIVPVPLDVKLPVDPETQDTEVELGTKTIVVRCRIGKIGARNSDDLTGWACGRRRSDTRGVGHRESCCPSATAIDRTTAIRCLNCNRASCRTGHRY